MLLTARDLRIFEAIQTHGPLPSHYLFEFTRHIHKDSTGFRKRLLQLMREGFLARPEQLNHPLIFTDFKVYALTPVSSEILRASGGGRRFSRPVAGDARHALMTACITANIELDASRAGYRFISQEDILSSSSCPQSTQLSDKPLSLKAAIAHRFERPGREPIIARSERPAEPDQLFGIGYPSGFRFFALEADRGSEPLTRLDLDGNSILRKLLVYQDVLSRQLYKSQWGVPNLFPTFVTTAAERAENMRALARTLVPAGSHFVLFKAIPGFRTYLRTPPLLAVLFNEPYLRTGDPLSIAVA